MTVVVVREDDADHLAVTISDEHARWAVDVDMRHGAFPRFDLTGQTDLTRLIRDSGTPPGLSRLLGGRGRGRATVDLSVLENRGGALIDAEGRVNRFRGDARVNVDTSSQEWRVDAAARLTARGIGRLVLLFARRRIKRGFDDGLARFWETAAYSTSHQLKNQLRDLARLVDDEGGEAAFVHRALWDPDFDPTLPST